MTELSKRARGVLLAERIDPSSVDSREAVRKLGYVGVLKLANAGKVTSQELCEWAGITADDPVRRKKEAIGNAIMLLEANGYVVSLEEKQ